MGLADGTDQQPRVGRDDLDVRVALGDQHPDRVEGAVGEEDGEGRGPGHEADRGQPGGRSDEVLLGDAHLEETVRVGLGELVGLRGVGQVTVQDHRARIAVAEFDELLAPDISHRLHARTPIGSLVASWSHLCGTGTAGTGVVLGDAVGEGVQDVELVRLELLSGELEVLFGRNDAVPGVLTFGHGQPLALDGVRQQDGRPTVRVAGPRQLEGVVDLVVVVPVDLDHPPAEGLEDRGEVNPEPGIAAVTAVGHGSSRSPTADRTVAARCDPRWRSGS